MRTREWTIKALAAAGRPERVLRIWTAAVLLQATSGSPVTWGEYPQETAECGDYESSTAGGDREDGQFGAGTGPEPDLPAASPAMDATHADANPGAVRPPALRGFPLEPSVCCDLNLIYPME